MDGDEFRSVREGGFDLNIRDHLRDTLHYLVAPQDVAARLQSGYGLALDVAACRRYDSRIGDEHFPYRLCPVALHSSP